jgi:hypothetical protein
MLHGESSRTGSRSRFIASRQIVSARATRQAKQEEARWHLPPPAPHPAAQTARNRAVLPVAGILALGVSTGSCSSSPASKSGSTEPDAGDATALVDTGADTEGSLDGGSPFDTGVRDSNSDTRPLDATSDTCDSTPNTVPCRMDSECAKGSQCAFTLAEGCTAPGTCVVPITSPYCIDPGGRCGCNGQPLQVFCTACSLNEYAFFPVAYIGECPIPCSTVSPCPGGFVCENEFCVTVSDSGTDQ